MYDYLMVQVPPNIRVAKSSGNDAAAYLQGIANQYASQGWEFYRVDTVGVVVAPGCLAALFGAKSSDLNYYVVTFRKPKATAV